jgi:hypothetical protein
MMKYFSKNDKKIDWNRTSILFLEKLEVAREKSGVPYVITRTYSTPEHSVAVGGSKTDAHTEIPCQAADIAAGSPRMVSDILRGLYFAGFNRIGIDTEYRHIHVDSSPNKDQNVFWIEQTSKKE